jgi:hypothetical protein
MAAEGAVFFADDADRFALGHKNGRTDFDAVSATNTGFMVNRNLPHIGATLLKN